MNDRDRLQQLRELLLRLERMPASADRDWMLDEVRARAVDVESGVAPAAVRALPVDGAEAESAAAAKPARIRNAPACRKPARVRPPRPPVPSPLPALRERSGSAGVVDLLKPGGLLCLDDPPADTSARPWACGLRG
jgi:hypothetical protein